MSVSLILNELAIARGRVGDLPDLPPAVAIVYPTEGTPFEVERVRTRGQRWFGGSRPCYVVDLSDHRRQAAVTRTPLTCSDGGHRFQATIDVGFRVHDPACVVQRNVRDPLSVVYGYLTGRIRQYAAQFSITEAKAAESRVNQELNLQVPLPEGITIYYCRVQMEPDEAAARYVRELEEAGWRSRLGTHAHREKLGEVRSEVEIEDYRAAARRRREQQERAALAGGRLDFEQLIREFLARHPEQSAQALEQLARVREGESAQWEVRQQRDAEMTRYLIEHGVIREVDLPWLRQGSLGPDAGRAGGMLPPANPSPPRPQDGPGPSAGPAPAPVALGAGSPVQWGGSSAPSAPVPPGGLIPVYLVLDTSVSSSGCTVQLGDMLRSVQTALAGSPDVASALRLSVITYNNGADVVLPLTEISWRTAIPALNITPGCRYRPVLRRLTELVPLETERLKQQAQRVLRPVVFLLAVGQAEDDAEWPAAHAELMAQTYHPHLVACAIGQDPVRTAQRLASRAELAVAAVESGDVNQSVVQFSVLVQQTLLHLGRTALAGRMELRLDCPQGLRPVADEH